MDGVLGQQPGGEREGISHAERRWQHDHRALQRGGAEPQRPQWHGGQRAETDAAYRHGENARCVPLRAAEGTVGRPAQADADQVDGQDDHEVVDEGARPLGEHPRPEDLEGEGYEPRDEGRCVEHRAQSGKQGLLLAVGSGLGPSRGDRADRPPSRNDHGDGPHQPVEGHGHGGSGRQAQQFDEHQPRQQGARHRAKRVGAVEEPHVSTCRPHRGDQVTGQQGKGQAHQKGDRGDHGHRQRQPHDGELVGRRGVVRGTVSAGDRLETTGHHQRRASDAELDKAIHQERPPQPRCDEPAHQTAQTKACHERRDDRADGLGGVAEDENELT